MSAPSKNPSRKKFVPLLLTLVVVLGLAAFFLSRQGISKEELLQAMHRFNAPALILVFVLCFVQVFFMIARVWVLFPASHRVSFRRVSEGMAFGQFLNTFAPARAGDVVKALVFSRGSQNGVTFLTGVGVLLSDRVVDIFALLLALFLSGAYRAPGIDLMPKLSAHWLLVLPVVAGILFAVYRWVTRRHPEKLSEWMRHFQLGLTVLRHPRQLLPGVFFGVAGWACEVGALHLLCKAQGLSLRLDQLVFVLFVLNLAIAVPISVANVGPFEAAIVFGLKLFGMKVPDAIAVATVHHWGQYAGIGAWALLMAVVRKFRPERTGVVLEGAEFEEALREKTREIARLEKASRGGILRIPREKERRTMLELARFDRPGASMIDLGCGAGFYSLEAKRAGLRVHAVDSSPAKVIPLHGKVDQIEIADVEKLEADEKYDRVICSGVLDSANDPERMFRGLCMLVAPGGRLVVLAPRQGLAGWIYRLEKKLFGARVNLFSRAWFEPIAREKGLEIVDCRSLLPVSLVLAFVRR